MALTCLEDRGRTYLSSSQSNGEGKVLLGDFCLDYASFATWFGLVCCALGALPAAAGFVGHDLDSGSFQSKLKGPRLGSLKHATVACWRANAPSLSPSPHPLTLVWIGSALAGSVLFGLARLEQTSGFELG